MVQLLLRLPFYLTLLLWVQTSWAAPSATNGFSLGLSGGALITSDVRGWEGVATSYKVHFGFPAWDFPLEATISAGGGGGDSFYGVRLVMLGEHPIDEELSILYWLGPNYLSFSSAGMESPRSSLGVSIGGGLMVRVSGALHLRLDMGLLSSPGSSAYSGLGLIFEF